MVEDQETYDVNAAVRDVIELRLSPRAETIATVRTVAADVSGRADFDLDTVSDVRMAVDEACNQVARLADPDHLMRVEFRMDPDGCLRVEISARTEADVDGIDKNGFGWHVLSALTDELETDCGVGADGDEVVVRLAKRDAPL
jgi:serine/threonine-protein kinase RsbW